VHVQGRGRKGLFTAENAEIAKNLTLFSKTIAAMSCGIVPREPMIWSSPDRLITDRYIADHKIADHPIT
jgi:hypothetical protein